MSINLTASARRQRALRASVILIILVPHQAVGQRNSGAIRQTMPESNTNVNKASFAGDLVKYFTCKRKLIYLN